MESVGAEAADRLQSSRVLQDPHVEQGKPNAGEVHSKAIAEGSQAAWQVEIPTQALAESRLEAILPGCRPSLV